MVERDNMLNTSGLGYITTRESAWLRKYLQDKRPDFAKLSNEAKDRVVKELLDPHRRDWLFVGWKIMLAALVIFSLTVFFLPFIVLFIPIILEIDAIFFFSFEVIFFVIIYGLFWVRKLHKIAMSDQAMLIINK